MTMAYFAPEDILRARDMDLLTYLRNYEPQNLVHLNGDNYCTREHDSLRISNGKWCWFSQGIGGRSALDYLIKVKGIPFTQAAEIILGREAEKPPVFYRQKERKHTELLMPELSETTDRVEKYLQGRGIHPVIIRYCLDNKLLFESADYHNAMFVGYDKDGKAAMTQTLRTAGEPEMLMLTPDRSTISADGNDLCYVTVTAVDKDGNVCPLADDQLTFEVSGEGTFKCACNGDATSLEPFTQPSMRLFNGKLVVTVQSSCKAGEIRLTVRNKNDNNDNKDLETTINIKTK